MSATEPEKSNSSAASFANLPVEDGSLTAPAASGVKKTHLEADAVMSDDDSKVITTLETAKSTSEKVIIHSQTIIKPAGTKDGAAKSASAAADDLLARMKSRLNKQIDLNVLTTPKMHHHVPHGTHDTSGSIEIPADFILGSDIPATPANVTKEELEDHDLIAILEGDDVEIMENATEIEVRVGGTDEDEQDLESEKKEREKEIAMRQMANLPQLPKGRRPKQALDANEIQEAKLAVVKPVASKRGISKSTAPSLPTLKVETGPAEVTPPPKPKLETKNSPARPVTGTLGGITIKGQTTITPLPKPIIIKTEPSEKKVSPSPTKKVMVPPSKPASVSTQVVPKTAPVLNSLPQKPSPVSNALPQKSVPVSKALPPKQKLNPSVPRPIPLPPPKKKTDDLISSIVSDWDDEPLVLKKEPVSPVASPAPKQASVSSAPATGLPMAPPQPPSAEEPLKRSRVIKKKIIWDPDNPETHMSFASFVKSNRTKPESQNEAQTTPTTTRPPGTGIRRKRAESVAVHMIKDTPPQFALPPPRKRARTPEPVSKPPVTSAAPVASKKKKKSEIDKLLGDEGAIKMLYDLECENSNIEKPSEFDDSDEESEKRIAIIKQRSSPNEGTTHVPRVRQKRHPVQTSTSPAPTATASTSEPPPRTSTSGVVGRKRKRPNSASEDWDYVYNSQKNCDDAMIIRRRSNSSYSSSTSPRRLSVDQPGATSTETTPADTAGASNFEFVKPSNKTPPKQEDIKLDSSLVANMKGKLSKVLGFKKEEQTASISSPPTSTGKKPEKKLKTPPKVAETATPTTSTTPTTTTTVRVEENGTDKSWESVHKQLTELKLQELTYKRAGNYVEIILASKDNKLLDVFTVELLNELKTVLNILKSDSNTRAVLLRSSGKHFCRGIDLAYLIQSNAEKRKTAAQVYSGHIRNFLQTLAMFNKPLVAAVHGDLLGMGVTILPLFDVVIAQDTTTFLTPYAVFGYLPEAMKLFSSAKNLKPKAITDMLFLSRKVSASTALDYGIVSEVTSSEKLQERADIVTKKLATLSQQALKAMKINLRKELLERLEDQLTFEQRKQSQQWVTAECQEKFKLFVSRGGNW
ncbi:proteoglycan 4 isoform X2 [Ochlerotatus camptorhynchus]|uniref:proteoglycan 4 isoform X2 n=1 Tax=Ochlerotatus camptorhynchus TaxID=644619 RepID=UPI0031E2D064